MNVNVQIEVLEKYADLFQEKFLEYCIKQGLPNEFPELTKLRTTHFEKNDFYQRLRGYINEVMGPNKAFHPKKLYTYIYDPLRNRLKNDSQTISWKVTKDFPNALFRLIDPKYITFEDFLVNCIDELPIAVKNQQWDYFRKYQEAGSQFKELKYIYHGYVANTKGKGLRIIKIGIYNDLSAQMLLEYKEGVVYEGKIEHNGICSFIAFKKKSGNGNGKKNGKVPEVAFQFFSGENMEERIFLFGTFIAINDIEFDPKSPALAAGPVIFERISPQSLLNTSFKAIPFIKPEEVDPILGYYVSDLRIEMQRPNPRLPGKNSFEELRSAELKDINKYAEKALNPEYCVGKYLFLIHSHTHNSFRKMILTIYSDLTVETKAIRYRDYPDVIQYKGRVNIVKFGLISFRANKEYGTTDFMECVMFFKNKHLPALGYCSGVFRGHPKAGKAVLIPVDDRLEGLNVDVDNPGFIEVDSKLFHTLDRQYNLVEFFAGDFLRKEEIDAGKIINESSKVFLPLKHKKIGRFKYLKGIYEEIYYDSNDGKIRKDFIQINGDGTALMRGKHTYYGTVEHLMSKMIMIFKSDNPGVFPVLYTFHIEEKSVGLSNGIFVAVTEDNHRVTSSKVILRKLPVSCETEDVFFQRTFEVIERDSELFHELNANYNQLGKRLLGRIDNSLSTAFYEKEVIGHSIADTYFNSACYLASKNNILANMQALKDLQHAFDHGYSNRKLLLEEMEEGGNLVHLKEAIDPESFRLVKDKMF